MATPRRAAARKREPLSRERIVVAALALVERDGLEAFSTRKLGRALGVEAMSLYHFFPTKQHLVDALVDAAIASVPIPEAKLAPLERLRRVARAYRAMAQRHARLFPLVAVHRLNTETGVRFIEALLGIVRDVTGDDESAARHFRAIGYYLTGMGLDETAGYAKGPSAAEPVSDEFIARECPLLARSGRYFARSEWDRTFEVGLEAMLAAIERSAKAR
ncbi:MAG: TetR/AcrR family transcriptional regulator [Burkholderiales bacterium]